MSADATTTDERIAALVAAEQRIIARRRRLVSVAVLVVAVVVAALMLWRDLRDERPHAAVGTLAASFDELPVQWRRAVLVPGTRYEVTAAVRDDVTDNPVVHARQAPDDGSFVALRIAESGRPGPSVPDLYNARNRPTGPAFTLVADGRRYPLPDLSDTFRSPPPGIAQATRLPVNAWLAVAGSGDRLELETSWQGRVQRLDLRSGERDTGSFAGVYRQREIGQPRTATTSCGTPVWTSGWRAGPGIPATCAYRAELTDWSADKGWARSGRLWLSLTTTMSSPSYPIRRVGGRDLPYRSSDYGSSSAEAYSVSDSPDRVDGAGPVVLRYLRDGTEGDSVVLVFDVARSSSSHTAVLTQSQIVRSRIDRSDANYYDGAIRQTWTVRVPA